MSTLKKTIGKIFIFGFLTILTQTGGLVYVLSIIIAKQWTISVKRKTVIVFTGLYVLSVFVITPLVAPVFGREPIKHANGITPTNYITVLLNRNYVTPQLNNLLSQTGKSLQGTPIKIAYLDANFPFINKFPLLPHLSHNDGKKIDLSLIYETTNGTITNKQKSVSGYGVFEDPKKHEYNQIDVCLKKGYFQYDYPKYMTLGKINADLKFSEKGTKQLIQSILKNKQVSKIFIEPHLKNRMHLTNAKIRYHGCRAVRHDDHIHIQIK